MGAFKSSDNYIVYHLSKAMIEYLITDFMPIYTLVTSGTFVPDMTRRVPQVSWKLISSISYIVILQSRLEKRSHLLSETDIRWFNFA